MKTPSIAALPGGFMTEKGDEAPPGVVEIGLLLPAHRAAALFNLARNREESVGQVIRRMIDQELSRACAGPG